MNASQRPAAAIGHIGPIQVSDVAKAASFYQDFGMRLVGNFGSMAILELRGGTHLLLRLGTPSPGQRVMFDIMVDDIDAVREACIAKGLSPSGVRRGGVHSGFELLDPDGQVVPVVSSHAVGAV